MVRPVMAFLTFATAGVLVASSAGPGLWRDLRLNRATLQVARDLKVEEASCTAHWWLLSHCMITYTGPEFGKKQSIHFGVFGTLGGERVHLMRTPDNYVTSDIGLAKLTNRIILAFFLTAFVIGICTLAFRMAVAAAA